MSVMREIEMSETSPSSESPLTFSPSFLEALEAPPCSAIPYPNMTSAVPMKRHDSRSRGISSNGLRNRRRREGFVTNGVGKAAPIYNTSNSTDHRRLLAIERQKAQGRDALKHFHTVSRGMGVTPFHIISIARSQALSKLFNKHTPLPRSERGKEMERVAREEGIRELETAIATVKRMKKAEMEVERRKSF